MRRALLLSLGMLAGCGPGLPGAPQSGESSSEGGGESTSTGTANPTTGSVAPDSTGGSTQGPTGEATVQASTGAETTYGTFIVAFDTPDFEECDTWAQDCPAGQKCTIYAENGGNSWNATQCVPVMEDPAKPGEPCFVVENGVSGIDNCELGSYCWDTNAENIGVCVAHCMGTPEAPFCEPGYSCAVFGWTYLHLCLKGCDPLVQDCPTADDLCIANPSSDGFLCVLAPSGGGHVHDPCEFANSCDKGLICLDSSAAVECDPAASGCCEPFCDLFAPNTCPGQGQVCTPYYNDPAPPEMEHIGFCSVPG